MDRCFGPIRHRHVVTAFDGRDGGTVWRMLGHALRKHLNSVVTFRSALVRTKVGWRDHRGRRESLVTSLRVLNKRETDGALRRRRPRKPSPVLLNNHDE